jgi:hypothetical protein
MVNRNWKLGMALIVAAAVIVSCYANPQRVVELKRFSLDNLQNVITQSGVEIDKEILAEGEASLRITAKEPRIIELYDGGDIDVEAARLIYQAQLRTDSLQGKAYLEMWCHFPGSDKKYFSRALQSSLSGTTDWATVETSFLLPKGQNPDNVKLDLVIEGTGIVWMDDIRLLKAPL